MSDDREIAIKVSDLPKPTALRAWAASLREDSWGWAPQILDSLADKVDALTEPTFQPGDVALFRNSPRRVVAVRQEEDWWSCSGTACGGSHSDSEMDNDVERGTATILRDGKPVTT